MGYALTVELKLETVTCGGCGMTFAIPSPIYRQYREDGVSIRCPNLKCPWAAFHQTESEVAKLKRELASATSGRRWAEENLESEMRSHAATRGQITKLHKRIAAGVCPCCRRSFQNLNRHMKLKHPDFAGKGEEG